MFSAVCVCIYVSLYVMQARMFKCNSANFLVITQRMNENFYATILVHREWFQA